VEGIKKALALIRKTKDGVVREGVCPKTFFLGLCNLIFSWLNPQHF